MHDTRRIGSCLEAAGARTEGSPAPSSIGLAWPPRYDGYNRRIKGFYPCLVDDPVQVRDTLDAAISLAEQHQDVTRVTLRFFVPSIYAPNHLWHPPSGWIGEVEASVDVSRVVPGHTLMYLGLNRPERILPQAIRSAERRDAWVAATWEPIDPEFAFGRLETALLRIEQLEHASSEDIAQITRLYQQAFREYLFPINEETVAEVVNNGNITLVVRAGSGQIVSSLVAEHAPCDMGNRTLNIIELSEAATDRNFRGNGLLTALYLRMLSMLRERHNPESSLVYAEARAPWPPVNIATRRAGFDYTGMLNQHCVLRSDRSPDMEYDGNMEDLNVWVHGAGIPQDPHHVGAMAMRAVFG